MFNIVCRKNKTIHRNLHFVNEHKIILLLKIYKVPEYVLMTEVTLCNNFVKLFNYKCLHCN